MATNESSCKDVTQVLRSDEAHVWATDNLIPEPSPSCGFRNMSLENHGSRRLWSPA
jgi:hypothetical protein